MRRVAIRLPDDGVWSGGVNYIETVCRALLAHPDLGWEPVVFCNTQGDESRLTRFAELLGPRLVRDSSVGRVRRSGLLEALFTGRDRTTRDLCLRERCDVFVEAAEFQGWRFPVACMVWIPDFQDRHLPHLFSRTSRYGKWLGLRLQLATGRTVLVSSEDARHDCERFYPASAGTIAVARFAVRPALAPGETDAGVAARHGLPERFFYLPNQYWVHKNHANVIRALALLKQRGLEVVVASSGNPRDVRNAGHFAELRSQVASGGLERQFLFLGNIPARDVALLMRSSVAMVNPSRFEGWSTTVEEAKSLGARMVLSALPVHREQVGARARMFDPDDPAAIAASLEQVWLEHAAAPALAEQEAAAADAGLRIRAFAEQLTRACELARTRFRAAS